MPGRRVAFAVLAVVVVAPGLAAQTLILDESVQWRRYYRFATDHVSAQAMKAEAAKVLDGATINRVRDDAQKKLNASGPDNFAVWRPSGAVLLEARKAGTSAALNATAPANADWRDFIFVRMFHDPCTAPPAPSDWALPGFDDSAWVLDRGGFQPGMLNDLPPQKYQGNMKDVHVGVLQFLGTGMHSAFYRTRLVVGDVAAAGELTLHVVYRGGVRAFINGKEVARGHLPKGTIAPETPGDDYPAEAYDDESKRDRALSAKVPQALLVKGANVLAVEVRASDLHPVVLRRQQSRSWNALHDREGQWRHGYLAKLELRGGPGVESGTRRPAGMQVWVEDIHRRVASTDFRMPGEGVGVARMVAPRNGTCSAQIVVGSDKDLAVLKASCGPLKAAGGASIPASAIRVLYGVPLPAADLSDKLGDERGLGPWFPTARDLADAAAMRKQGPYVFDQLTLAPPARVPAGASWNAWLSLDVPKDAAPGKYSGAVTVAAQGMAPVSVPVELEVIGWTLPEPKDFRTFVACEENPYGVAKFYGVAPWSKEHLALLEASFREMGRIGNDWLNVPVLARTEYGNGDDALIKWTRKRDGSLAFDFKTLDAYLDLAVKHWGKPRVVQFAVMHGMAPRIGGAPPTVNAFDERTGKVAPLAADGPDKRKIWEAFGKAVWAHMTSKGLEKSVHWGHPMDGEPDHELVVILGEAVPGAKWVGGPHQIGRGGYPEPKYYDAWGTVRYFNNWPGWRMDRGWKAPTAHLAIPRIDSSVLSLHTASHPFAFRTFTDHALALGRAGISRVGGDGWSGAHYDGMRIPTWIVGMPVLFTLWPGKEGAETSARHEALLEGIQEGEARIAIEQALDRGAAPKRLEAVLDEHARGADFFQNKLCIFELEKYHHGWQERSRALYKAAAEAGK